MLYIYARDTQTFSFLTKVLDESQSLGNPVDHYPNQSRSYLRKSCFQQLNTS